LILPSFYINVEYIIYFFYINSQGERWVGLIYRVYDMFRVLQRSSFYGYT